MLHFLTSEAEYVALNEAVKKLYFEDTLSVSWSSVRECHAFQSLRTIRVQCNCRKTRCRPQLPKYIDVRHHLFRELVAREASR